MFLGLGPGPETGAATRLGIRQDPVPFNSRRAEYDIRASLIIIGDLGRVGALTVEESRTEEAGRPVKMLRMAGGTRPEQAAKGRDYGGEFSIIRPIGSNGGAAGGAGAANGSAPGGTYRGFLRKNGRLVGERVVFHPGCVVTTREDGTERTIEGAYESPLAALEHFLEAEVRAGDIHESHFIMDGRPYLFRCEVGRPVRVAPFPDPAFPIAVTTYDGLETDARGRPKVKKKGGIRVWLCKEGRYRNTVLRIHLKHTWYLTLKFDLVRVESARS